MEAQLLNMEKKTMVGRGGRFEKQRWTEGQTENLNEQLLFTEDYALQENTKEINVLEIKSFHKSGEHTPPIIL